MKKTLLININHMLFHRKTYNAALKVLLSTNALVLLAGAMLAPIYALFIEERGGGLLEASYTVAVFMIVAGITSIISGKLVDSIKNPAIIIVIGYICIGIGFFGFTHAATLTHILLLQGLIGFAEAFYSPAFDAIYTNHTQKWAIGRQWAAWETMNYFTAAVGALVGGYIVVSTSFVTMFYIMTLVCFISAFYILLNHKILR